MNRYLNWKTKIIHSLAKLLKQGLNPKKLSIVIALGITLSVFPVLGATTLLCTVISITFNLNLPAIQLANYAAFPLQIILFFPFLKIGEQVSKVSLNPLSKVHLIATFDEGFVYAFLKLFDYLMIACLGWSLVIIPMFLFFYLLLYPIFNKYEKFLADLDTNK
jgi:uncharacterized protein (DUF2062 family)